MNENVLTKMNDSIGKYPKPVISVNHLQVNSMFYMSLHT